MLNPTKCFAKIAFCLSATALVLSSTLAPASSQVVPEVWGILGVEDDDLTFGAGTRWTRFGLEIGVGEEGAVGADFLTFFPLSAFSPYVGLGIYSEDQTLAFSGGVHYYPGSRIFFGAGYHTVRGINGKVGFKL